MKRLVIILFSLYALASNAQTAIGGWAIYPAYLNATQLAQSPEKIYVLSSGNLFSVDKDIRVVETYTRIEGLSATDITYIAYSAYANGLLIAYRNGMIDILYDDGSIASIPDLANKDMSASKQVHDVLFLGTKALLATDFGILSLNLQKLEIADTYYIGANATEVSILSLAMVDDTIYAASADTVYYAFNNSNRMLDYAYWKRLTLPSAGRINQICAFRNTLFLLQDSCLYQHAFNQPLSRHHFTFVKPENNQLYGAAHDSIFLFSMDTANGHWEISATESLVLRGSVRDIAYESAQHRYWGACLQSSLISLEKDLTYNYYRPTTPSVNGAYRLRYYGDKLYVLPGRRWAVQYNVPGYCMVWQNNRWTNYKTGFTDCMNAAQDPADESHFFVTTYGHGMFEFKDNKLIASYNDTNSVLLSCIPGSHAYCRTDGAIFDAYGNLWLCNAGDATQPPKNLVIFTKDGRQLSTNLTKSGSRVALETPGEILIDRQYENYKWIPSCRATVGLVLYDDRSTPTDLSDDRWIFRGDFIDEDGNSLAPGAVYCFVQDKEGNYWLGTDNGPLMFDADIDFFTSNRCTRVKINREDGSGLADYLLNGEQINAIAVDGTNRKWFGTATSGIYLMSEDGQTTLQHFTKDNSPLLSNNIYALAINPKTGEVMIGTDEGLLSYQSDAAEDADDFSEVYAYPNPVREDYQGAIIIAGLVDETIVKITDAAGHLVCQTRSNGSLAMWDGCDQNGKRVHSGVYVAVCEGPQGTLHATTKILIIH